MKKSYILSLLIGVGLSAFGSTMPSTSVMAGGNWTKLRIETDGVYQFTYDQLKELGYSNPADVKLFGYSPTLLIRCSFETIPGDLVPIHTVNLPEQKKILFYLSDNYDSNPEIWRTKFASNDAAKRKRHINSIGATYFLSDVESPEAPFTASSAPSKPDAGALTTHRAVYYHERDLTSLTEAGALFMEPAVITKTHGATHPFTVSHLASPNATLLFGSYVAPTGTDAIGYLETEYSDGIIAGETVGSKPNLLLQKEILTPDFRSQEITLPLTTEPQTHTVTFRVPEQGSQQKPCALDFFVVKYDRSNNVGVRPQSMMYFQNENKPATFALTGINSENWKVWNITDPANICEIGLLEDSENFYGSLPAVATGYANEVIAFDATATHPSPEIIGRVENQNLHSMEVPQMLIIAAAPMLPAAEKIAAMHSQLQGYEVAIVNQSQIFNEYSSGNTSPEAVRRFITQLSEREPSKLQGVLLLGPATFNNKDLVNDNNLYVVTAQCEEPVLARNVTTNYCADVYFVCAGEPVATTPWAERHSTFCVFANKPIAGIGRVPFKSMSEIDDYYSKVKQYLTELPTYPSVGNIIVASDYSTPTEKSRTHLNDSELMLNAMDTTKQGLSVTITRCGSNLFSKDDNTVVKHIQSQALARGAQLYAFFGHGTATGISGSTSVNDPIMTVRSAQEMCQTVHTPFMFMGSCHVAAVDIYDKTLAGALLSNPNGGSVAVISSGREVFPENNTELSREVAFGLDSVSNETPIGIVWSEASGRFINRLAAYRKSICNTLNYNLIGDPMIPVYRPTHAVEINPVAGNTMSFVEPTEISGRITDLKGNPTTDFNGTVVLTIYDTPITKANVNTTNPSKNPGYIESMVLDQEIIGQATAEVKNGIFKTKIIAPPTSGALNHRIQAYAYSSDATLRGLGYINGLDFVETGTPDATTYEPAAIESFEVKISESPNHKHKVTFSAIIDAPAGIAYSNSLVNPVKLTLDGKAQNNAVDMITATTDGKYRFDYTTAKLEFGNHTARLEALDGAGNWAEETIYFMVDNTPATDLSVAVEGEEVNFELASEVTNAVHRLVVENLNGDPVLDETFSGLTHKATLAPGVYRAFVQVRSNSVASATPKIRFAVH